MTSIPKMIDLNYLTEAERDVIVSVLRRDEQLQKQEQARVNKLKIELQAIRRKGALRPGQDAEKTCARCRTELGLFINTGSLCPKCQQKVCKNCQTTVPPSDNVWLCKLCYTQRLINMQSGKWFYEYLITDRKKKSIVLGSDVVRASIRRTRAQNRRTPPSHHSPNNSIDEEGSDTQSTADSKGEGSITGHKILESSVEKSAEITRKTESPRESPHIVVRRVSNKPPVSDSDSDNEEDKKPPVIPTTQKSPCLSQKSAISAVSSDRTTIISTSDDEYASPKSSDANSPPLHSTLLSTNGPKAAQSLAQSESEDSTANEEDRTGSHWGGQLGGLPNNSKHPLGQHSPGLSVGHKGTKLPSTNLNKHVGSTSLHTNGTMHDDEKSKISASTGGGGKGKGGLEHGLIAQDKGGYPSPRLPRGNSFENPIFETDSDIETRCLDGKEELTDTESEATNTTFDDGEQEQSLLELRDALAQSLTQYNGDRENETPTPPVTGDVTTPPDTTSSPYDGHDHSFPFDSAKTRDDVLDNGKQNKNVEHGDEDFNLEGEFQDDELIPTSNENIYMNKNIQNQNGEEDSSDTLSVITEVTEPPSGDDMSIKSGTIGASAALPEDVGTGEQQKQKMIHYFQNYGENNDPEAYKTQSDLSEWWDNNQTPEPGSPYSSTSEPSMNKTPIKVPEDSNFMANTSMDDTLLLNIDAHHIQSTDDDSEEINDQDETCASLETVVDANEYHQRIVDANKKDSPETHDDKVNTKEEKRVQKRRLQFKKKHGGKREKLPDEHTESQGQEVSFDEALNKNLKTLDRTLSRITDQSIDLGDEVQPVMNQQEVIAQNIDDGKMKTDNENKPKPSPEIQIMYPEKSEDLQEGNRSIGRLQFKKKHGGKKEKLPDEHTESQGQEVSFDEALNKNLKTLDRTLSRITDQSIDLGDEVLPVMNQQEMIAQHIDDGKMKTDNENKSKPSPEIQIIYPEKSEDLQKGNRNSGSPSNISETILKFENLSPKFQRKKLAVDEQPSRTNLKPLDPNTLFAAPTSDENKEAEPAVKFGHQLPKLDLPSEGDAKGASKIELYLMKKRMEIKNEEHAERKADNYESERSRIPVTDLDAESDESEDKEMEQSDMIKSDQHLQFQNQDEGVHPETISEIQKIYEDAAADNHKQEEEVSKVESPTELMQENFNKSGKTEKPPTLLSLSLIAASTDAMVATAPVAMDTTDESHRDDNNENKTSSTPNIEDSTNIPDTEDNTKLVDNSSSDISSNKHDESEHVANPARLMRSLTCPSSTSTPTSAPPPKPNRQHSISSETSDTSQTAANGTPERNRRVLPVVSISDDQQLVTDELHDDFKEDENIDELFATHRQNTSQGNLNISFGGSKESLASYYSDAGDVNYGRIPVSGAIFFAVEYNYKTGFLMIHIKRCRDLAAADSKKNRSDPYVKTYLLPDRTRNGKRKTKTKKHTLNPTYEETLKYHVSKSELDTRTLELTVWHSEAFGKNDFLGEVLIHFDDFDFNDTTPKWYQLQEKLNFTESPMVYKGDLFFSVKYITPENVSLISSPGKKKKKSKKDGNMAPGAEKKGQLHVLIKHAQNLIAMDANGFSDPFVKAYLLPDKAKHSKQKTKVIKKNLNPQWHETFVFEDVELEELQERCLEITVWDHDNLSSNDFLGGLRLGNGTGRTYGREVDWMDSRGEEICVWQKMLEQPNTWVDGEIMLRASMGNQF